MSFKDKEIEASGKMREDLTGIDFTFPKAMQRISSVFVGSDLLIKFKVLRYSRSDAQNRWLWGVAYPTIAGWHKETQGERITADEIHAITCSVILGRRLIIKEKDGVEYAFFEGKTSSQLNTKEFTELMEQLQQFWAEKGCYIADPKQNNLITDHLNDF